MGNYVMKLDFVTVLLDNIYFVAILKIRCPENTMWISEN